MSCGWNVNIKSLIVRFTAREEIPRKFPREPHVFPIIVTFAKPQVFYYLMSDAKIFDIIYQLSSLLECDPTVCLPEILFSGRQTVESHSNKGDNCIRLRINMSWDRISMSHPPGCYANHSMTSFEDTLLEITFTSIHECKNINIYMHLAVNSIWFYFYVSIKKVQIRFEWLLFLLIYFFSKSKWDESIYLIKMRCCNVSHYFFLFGVISHNTVNVV